MLGSDGRRYFFLVQVRGFLHGFDASTTVVHHVVVVSLAEMLVLLV